MTIILACRISEGAVMIADSRATWERTTGQPTPALYQDTLQKILPLGPRIAIGYAGDVQAAALIIREIRRRMKANPRLQILRKLAAEIPRLAKHYYHVYVGRTGRRANVALVLGGVIPSGSVGVWWYTSPDFGSHDLSDRFKVLGSGSVIVSQIEAVYGSLDSFASLKNRTDALVRALDEGLSRAGVPSVGGLFQVP